MSATAALVEVGEWLKAQGYSFTTVTPETHRRVNARESAREAGSIRDVFGWSRPFARALVPKAILDALIMAGALEDEGARVRSRVRFSTLGDGLYVHSAYPTTDAGAVFFGPDSYRFCALLDRMVPAGRHVLDVGCGSGVGGLSLAGYSESLVLLDINPTAIAYARVNTALAKATATATILEGDLYAPLATDARVDVIVANPPYLLDPAKRTYRDGGGELGTGLALRIVAEGLPRLSPGGMLVLYTGAPVVAGEDVVRWSVEQLATHAGATLDYRELDPDVFGEELEREAYREVERIAAVAAIFTMRGDRASRGRASALGELRKATVR